MTSPIHITTFDDEGLLYSEQFGDHYFSRNGGSAECQHVFLNGNNLPQRWENGLNFNIGELGFGTGLSFLTVWRNWRQIRRAGQILHFTSVEAFPVDKATAKRALTPYDDFGSLRDDLLNHWDQITASGPSRFSASPSRPPSSSSSPPPPLEFDAQTKLQVVVRPVEEALEYFAQIDAWFLDGFAPSKNPDMWSLPVMQKLAERTATGGTFASYTAAGWVRRNLQAAGFEVAKHPGFGTKRDMIAGRLA
ncbi:MAG: tRNA (5-methylaminomethyl-2-thiouridine)(34)-methyltransferase MnmD [Rhizobiaceae bacterium]